MAAKRSFEEANQEPYQTLPVYRRVQFETFTPDANGDHLACLYKEFPKTPAPSEMESIIRGVINVAKVGYLIDYLGRTVRGYMDGTDGAKRDFALHVAYVYEAHENRSVPFILGFCLTYCENPKGYVYIDLIVTRVKGETEEDYERDMEFIWLPSDRVNLPLKTVEAYDYRANHIMRVAMLHYRTGPHPRDLPRGLRCCSVANAISRYLHYGWKLIGTDKAQGSSLGTGTARFHKKIPKMDDLCMAYDSDRNCVMMEWNRGPARLFPIPEQWTDRGWKVTEVSVPRNPNGCEFKADRLPAHDFVLPPTIEIEPQILYTTPAIAWDGNPSKFPPSAYHDIEDAEGKFQFGILATQESSLGDAPKPKNAPF